MDFKQITDKVLSKHFDNTVTVNIEDARLYIKYNNKWYDTISINKEHGTFKMFKQMDRNGFDISDEYCFEVYFDAICGLLKSQLIDEYKKEYHKTLPFQYDEIKQISDISITTEDFIEIFNNITNECGNGETAFDVNIDLENRKIKFSIDCHRYGIHTRNNIYINKYGIVKVNLCELLEGGDIECELIEVLTNKINK